VSAPATGLSTAPSRHEVRARLRDDMSSLANSLVAEFGALLPAATVTRHVARAREDLLSAGVRAGLVAATETMARHRLMALVPAHAGRPAR
jgi:hypothetical protein